MEVNLLADEGKLGTESCGRVFEAQIAFRTHLSVPNSERTKTTKSISLGLVIAFESNTTFDKQYVLHTMSLRFDDVF